MSADAILTSQLLKTVQLIRRTTKDTALAKAAVLKEEKLAEQLASELESEQQKQPTQKGA